MMNQDELKRKFLNLGWVEVKMLGGGYLSFALQDRILNITPTARRISIAPVVDWVRLEESVTTKNFNKYCAIVANTSSIQKYSLQRQSPPLNLELKVGQEEEIERSNLEIISWAKSIDLNLAISLFLKYPIDSGLMALTYKFVAMKMSDQDRELMEILKKINHCSFGEFKPWVTSELLRRVIDLDVSSGL